MKKINIILCVVFSSVLVKAQNTDEQAIRNVMNYQVKAWNQGNIDAFMETYWKSDSLVFVGSAGPAYGWKTTLEGYKKRYPDTTAMGRLNFDILQI